LGQTPVWLRAEKLDMKPVAVLSVNTWSMGHIAYQLGLERAFPLHAPEVAFHSVHLSEENRNDFFGKLAYRILTLRLPGAAGTDRDWIRFRSELGASLFLRRLLQRLIPVRRPDVLHLHTQSIALLARDIVQQVPGVVSIDCTAALLARLHPPPAMRTYLPLIRLEKACFEAAAHVVSWSETARNSVVEDYGIARERTSVIHPFAPNHAFPDEKRERQAGAKLRLLFVGNDFRRKGGEDLLAVFQDSLHETCELDIVSNGLATLPAQGGLRFHKGLEPFSPALMKLYADADVFVMPTYEEAFGLVYLEAMAAGLPCIGGNVLAVPELVAHGIRGLIVTAGDRRQLAEAVGTFQDRTVWRRMSQACREFARTQCDERTNCRRLSAVFARVAETHDLRKTSGHS
jgi:alpha-maltose-1-phosphate synthase